MRQKGNCVLIYAIMADDEPAIYESSYTTAWAIGQGLIDNGAAREMRIDECRIDKLSSRTVVCALQGSHWCDHVRTKTVLRDQPRVSPVPPSGGGQ